jgi:hypothetical protein
MTAITGQTPAGPVRPAAAAPRELVADEGHPRRWWILAVLGAVALVPQLDTNYFDAQQPRIQAGKGF